MEKLQNKMMETVSLSTLASSLGIMINQELLSMEERVLRRARNGDKIIDVLKGNGIDMRIIELNLLGRRMLHSNELIQLFEHMFSLG